MSPLSSSVHCASLPLCLASAASITRALLLCVPPHPSAFSLVHTYYIHMYVHTEYLARQALQGKVGFLLGFNAPLAPRE